MAAARFCTNCGYLGKLTSITKGSFLIELFLWLCLLVPGVLYSLWRVTSRTQGCPSCGAATMIPADSPRARQLMAGGRLG